MKLYFVDYFYGYTEQEVFEAIKLLPEKRKKEVYKIYDEDLFLRDIDEYVLLSMSTMSLIRSLLIINRKNKMKVEDKRVNDDINIYSLYEEKKQKIKTKK